MQAAIDPIEIATRYAAGESMQALAAEHRVHRSSLYRWLLAAQGDKDYADLVTHCLVQRVAEGDEMLEKAVESSDIARAREIAKFARMDLERRRPQLYGAKQETLAINIAVQIVAFSQHPEEPMVQCLEGTGVMSNLPAPQHVAHQQHLSALAALSPDDLRAMQAEAERRIAEGRDGSPVAPGLVDSVGDQSASVVSERGS